MHFLKQLAEKIGQLYSNFYLWMVKVGRAKTDFKVPFGTKVKYALRNFSANEYVWYNLKDNDYREYISEYERMCSRNINGPYKVILDNKLLFWEIFRHYVKTPACYAWVSNGNVYGLHGQDINNDNVVDFMLKTGKTVLKREDGSQGSGVDVIEAVDGVLHIKGKPKTRQEIEQLFQGPGHAILSEYASQSQFENELYPHATNTIRIVCAKKRNETTAHIIKAVQRIGNDACRPVDNVSAGGFASQIDLQTGELGPAVAKLGPMDRRMKFFDNHPDTGNPIAGRVIPNWEAVKEEIVNLTNQFPYLNFVAWDVLLTEDGISIIEGNASSGCGMFQMEHGVRNSELGDIYRSYGIIP